jgi:hypothetical protein
MKLVHRMRIGAAKLRYDFWLDLCGVSRRQRRELRRELGSNLADAAGDVGLTRALVNVGGLRRLALESSRGVKRTSWSAGISAGLIALALAVVSFFALALYYTQGVLDSEVNHPVSNWLFPFFGSSIEVQSGDSGFSVGLWPGWLPLLVGFVVFLAVARPWRELKGRRHHATPAPPTASVA